VKVFLTGVTGFIGSAVARALLGAGHHVTGLCRNPARARSLERSGLSVLRGDLAEPDAYRAAAGAHDVLVHTAMDYAGDTAALDRTAVDTLLGAASSPATSARRFLYTSGCWVLGDTGDADAAEDASTAQPADLVRWRVGHERAVLDAADAGTPAVVIRPGLVYGGAGSLTAAWYRGAARDGAATVIGDGANHWSFVQVTDLARLYVALVEADAVGVFHGADNHPIEAREAVAAASRAAGAGGRVRHVPLEEARASLGAVADALTLEQRVVTARAAEVGWAPRCESYVECVDAAFAEWRDAPR
jgi:nucleoside-diphosphate-sugar epimerase